MKEETIEIIDSEVEYALGWDTVSENLRPQKDSDKPVEFWLNHIRRYLGYADESCKSVDKTNAFVNIRKIAALCVRCIDNNDVPKREESKLEPY